MEIIDNDGNLKYGNNNIDISNIIDSVMGDNSLIALRDDGELVTFGRDKNGGDGKIYFNNTSYIHKDVILKTGPRGLWVHLVLMVK